MPGSAHQQDGTTPHHVLRTDMPGSVHQQDGTTPHHVLRTDMPGSAHQQDGTTPHDGSALQQNGETPQDCFHPDMTCNGHQREGEATLAGCAQRTKDGSGAQLPCPGDPSKAQSQPGMPGFANQQNLELIETQRSQTPGKSSSSLALQHSVSESTTSQRKTKEQKHKESEGSAPACPTRGDLEAAALRRKILLSKVKVTTMADVRKTWQRRSEDHLEGQRLNPFSDEFDHSHAMSIRLQKGDKGYGRPKEGSATEQRGQRAKRHVHKEMEDLCLVIRDMGVQGRDGRRRVTFGRLFEHYVRISDKVVGILLRARKHGMLDFEGEMLWQGVHDRTVITLLKERLS